MCGIAGLIVPGQPAPALAEQLGPMVEALRHRGPDDGGLWSSDGIALGMRRLAIIDRTGGRQPMHDPQTGVVLVYNGEVYNHAELRRELTAAGHRFATRSDTEVVLRAYLAWGADAFARLEGMFALAVCDPRQRCCWLARDAFGIKPLYYAAREGWFAFASEPQPLYSLLKRRRLDPAGLAQFLRYKFTLSPQTLLTELAKLPPGTRCRIGLDDARAGRTERFWELVPEPPDVPEDVLLDEIEHALLASVRRQLVADVPVGVFLSGGIDSALLLWAASAVSAQPPTALTIAFPDSPYDESGLASQTARSCGVPHEIEPAPPPSPQQLATAVVQFGEPFGNVSVLPCLTLAQVASRRGRVFLNGTGGDELFLGYQRYLAVATPPAARWVARTTPWLEPVLATLPLAHSSRALAHRVRRFLQTQKLPPAERHAAAIRLAEDDVLGALAPELPFEDDPLPELFKQAPQSLDAVDRAAWVDCHAMLPDDYLLLVDRTTMAYSVEGRVPFLDRRLAALAFGIAARYKLRGTQTKRLLRRLARRHLPRSVVRGPKRGFEPPAGAWFRGPLGERLLERARTSPLADVLRPEGVARILRLHRGRRAEYARLLLGLYTLYHWCEEFGIGC